MLPFAVLGTACIVLGGLVSAAIAPAPTEHGAWAAAYLVLVGGVAQVALGAGQALLAPAAPPRRAAYSEMIGWNTGNVAVLTGTLLGFTWLADIGGAVLVVSLALVIRQMRGTVRRPAWPLYLYRGLVALVLVSIPVGLVLAEFRSV
ncbi:MAG: hypothetical protein ACRDPO_32025 [Streptosporangiaceae bacterium]